MSSSKIVQLIGEYDREFGTYAFNRTESQFQIRGADLGSSFLHGGKLYFLFGDTPRTQVPLPLKPNMSDYARQYFLDSIAYTTDPFVFGGLKLTFNSQYPLVNDISQGDFEVPTEGVSVGGNMYVYFTTDHTNQRVMGRTVLARSTDGGLNFGDSLYTLSTDKFINVSVQIVKNGQLAGLPIPAENGLLIFGSGQYRASDVCLVYMPLDAIEDPSKSKLRYFAGLAPGSSLPLWSAEETQAVPLFQAGCIGEFSVRWNFYLGRWFILYNCGNPRGIILRTATLPWGPWSDSNRIFHPWEDGGYCHFMHRAWEADPATHCDNVADDMWNPGQFRVDEWGGEYGPYQIQPYVSGVKGHYTKIYYTLSTANPYSVMQMTTVILTEGEALDPNAYAYDATVPNDRKYARISILQAQLAAARNMSWDFLGQGSQSCADHIEWAQFQSHL